MTDTFFQAEHPVPVFINLSAMSDKGEAAYSAPTLKVDTPSPEMVISATSATAGNVMPVKCLPENRAAVLNSKLSHAAPEAAIYLSTGVLMNTNWEDEKHEEIFNRIYANLERRRADDPEFTVSTLESILRGLYNQEGNNWEGMSELRHVTLMATIAAHEHMLAEMKKEARR